MLIDLIKTDFYKYLNLGSLSSYLSSTSQGVRSLAESVLSRVYHVFYSIIGSQTSDHKTYTLNKAGEPSLYEEASSDFSKEKIKVKRDILGCFVLGIEKKDKNNEIKEEIFERNQNEDLDQTCDRFFSSVDNLEISMKLKEMIVCNSDQNIFSNPLTGLYANKEIILQKEGRVYNEESDGQLIFFQEKSKRKITHKIIEASSILKTIYSKLGFKTDDNKQVSTVIESNYKLVSTNDIEKPLITVETEYTVNLTTKEARLYYRKI